MKAQEATQKASRDRQHSSIRTNFLSHLEEEGLIIPPILQTSTSTGPTIIALGHGDITCERRIPYPENVSFVYPDECGSYAYYMDALNFIRVHSKLSSANIHDLRTIVNVANQNNNRPNKLKVGVQDYYETTCSNVFNFKSDVYDWVCLSGIHYVNGTTIGRMKESFSVLKKIDGKSYINKDQVSRMYAGALFPIMNDQILNMLFNNNDEISFDYFNQSMVQFAITFTKLLDWLRAGVFKIGVHLNLVFANCRVICQNGKSFASIADPRYPNITHDPELVALVRTKSGSHEEEKEDEGIRVNAYRSGYEWYNTLSRKTLPVVFSLSFDQKFLHAGAGNVEIFFNNQDRFYYITPVERVNNMSVVNTFGYGGRKKSIKKRKHNKKKQKSKKY
jgi:hypothetical protein